MKVERASAILLTCINEGLDGGGGGGGGAGIYYSLNI